MPTPLMRTGELITSTWQAFLKSWETTVRYSAWFALAGVLQVVDAFIPSNQDMLIVTVGILGPLAAAVVSIWASVALYKVVFAVEAGEKVTDKTVADLWPIIPPLLLIGILQGLATFGALLVFVLPGIYVGIRLGFSQLVLFSKGLRGRAALADSWAMTKGRFWPIFGRQLAGVVVFGLLMIVIVAAAFFVVSLVAGGAKLGMLLAADKPSATGFAITTLVQSIIQAAFIPLFVIFQVKLYKAVDKTR